MGKKKATKHFIDEICDIIISSMKIVLCSSADIGDLVRKERRNKNLLQRQRRQLRR